MSVAKLALSAMRGRSRNEQKNQQNWRCNHKKCGYAVNMCPFFAFQLQVVVILHFSRKSPVKRRWLETNGNDWWNASDSWMMKRKKIFLHFLHKANVSLDLIWERKSGCLLLRNESLQETKKLIQRSHSRRGKDEIITPGQRIIAFSSC